MQRLRHFFQRVVLCLALASPGLEGCSRTPLFSPAPLHTCLPIDPSGVSSRTVSADVQLVRSDILFLVDNSASMEDEIDRIRKQLRDVLAPQIRARLPDSDLGLAVFSDFGSYMTVSSHPYLLLQPMTEDEEKVRAATKEIDLEYGGDEPESQLEALYQAATGKGYGIYIKAKTDCPPDTHGGVCFREGAFAIVLLFTDAPMRNVTGLLPSGNLAPEEPFDRFSADAPYIPYVRTYDETIEALNKAHIHVLGLWSGTGDGIDDMRRVARDTQAVDENGEPIVFDIGPKAQALGDGVVSTLAALTAAVSIDVRLVALDGDPEDGLDPTTLITSVRAVRADPEDGALPDGERFARVRTGTRVFFEIEFDTSSLPQSDAAQRYPIALRVEGEDGTLLSQQTLDLVVAAQSPCAANSQN